MEYHVIRCAGCSRPLATPADICAWCDAEDAENEAALQRKLKPRYRCPGCGGMFDLPEQILRPAGRKWYQLQRYHSACPLCACQVVCRHRRRFDGLLLMFYLSHLLLPELIWYFWHDNSLTRQIMLALDMVLISLMLIQCYRMSGDTNRFYMTGPHASAAD